MLLFAEMRVEEVAQVSFESVEVLLKIFAEGSVGHGKTLIKEWDFGIEKCPCFFAGRSSRGNKRATRFLAAAVSDELLAVSPVDWNRSRES